MLVNEAQRRVGIALSNPADGGVYDVFRIINDAGEYMFSAREWRFAKTVTGKAHLIKSREYVDLPLGCVRLHGIERADGWVGRVRHVDAATFVAAKAALPGETDLYIVTEDYSPADDESGPPRLRLALHRAASESATNAFLVSYAAGWTQVAGGIDDMQTLPFPSWCDAVFGALLDAFAMGMEEPETGTTEQRVAMVRGGPLFAAAREMDFRAFPDVGPPRNTAIEVARHRFDTRLSWDPAQVRLPTLSP